MMHGMSILQVVANHPPYLPELAQIGGRRRMMMMLRREVRNELLDDRS